MEIDQFETQSDNEGKIFTFISVGKMNIIKIIRYDREDIIYNDLIGNMLTASNLGFGDKKSDTYQIDDIARSNNGDMFMVFNTILHTIPIFFSKMNNTAIHIKGADKVRHIAYHRFLNQRYDELINEYYFYGSLNRVIYPYEKGTIYDYIVALIKK